jgi:flagellar assembly factor FliW
MEVRTTKFGVVTIQEDRIITFPKGLLGFENCTRFCIFEPGADACFFWLQSIDREDLAFVITDPTLFVPDYSVPFRAEQMAELGLGRLEDAQVFTIVNKIDEWLTGNLQGPLVINTQSRVGEQLVLVEKRWTTRHRLVQVASVEQPARISA